MLVCVRSDLASEPGAANTFPHRACSPGSVARYCMLACVRSDLALEPGAANTCSHRAWSPGTEPGTACLYVLGQTWPQRQVLPIHVYTELAVLAP